MTTASESNPIGIIGFDFIEFSAPDTGPMEALFENLGFSKLKIHETKNISYFQQNDIHFFLNAEKNSFASTFCQDHGPCAVSTGWRVKNAQHAFDTAIKRGATVAEGPDLYKNGKPIPAIQGVGGSLIYFTDDHHQANRLERWGFQGIPQPKKVPPKGFYLIDHLTNNVFQGQLEPLASFYKKVFGFTEVRYFDIKGEKTGLLSYALRSPCGSFCIPINEGTEDKSQINEYLRDYKGEGIQHIAFLTPNILESMDAITSTSPIETLDIDDEYYQTVFKRVPNVTEDHQKIRTYNLLVDGDDDGYLIQIFTKNVIGPIFFEFIQRKNHTGFGEGNFGALFRAIERDQERRGVLE